MIPESIGLANHFDIIAFCLGCFAGGGFTSLILGWAYYNEYKKWFEIRKWYYAMKVCKYYEDRFDEGEI